MIPTNTLTLEIGGKITLPETVRKNYGFVEQTPIRLIETKNGVLLIPLTEEPMSEELKNELEEWQMIGLESLEMFP